MKSLVDTGGVLYLQYLFLSYLIIIQNFILVSRHPTVKWAQRPDKLYITAELPDAKNVKLQLEPEGRFVFSATSGADNLPYELDMDLFDKVDVNVRDKDDLIFHCLFTTLFFPYFWSFENSGFKGTNDLQYVFV